MRGVTVELIDPIDKPKPRNHRFQRLPCYKFWPAVISHMLFELLARRSNVQVARYLGPIVIHVPNTVADDLVNTMGRAKECCHEG